MHNDLIAAGLLIGCGSTDPISRLHFWQVNVGITRDQERGFSYGVVDRLNANWGMLSPHFVEPRVIGDGSHDHYKLRTIVKSIFGDFWDRYSDGDRRWPCRGWVNRGNVGNLLVPFHYVLRGSFSDRLCRWVPCDLIRYNLRPAGWDVARVEDLIGNHFLVEIERRIYGTQIGSLRNNQAVVCGRGGALSSVSRVSISAVHEPSNYGVHNSSKNPSPGKPSPPKWVLLVISVGVVLGFWKAWSSNLSGWDYVVIANGYTLFCLGFFLLVSWFSSFGHGK